MSTSRISNLTAPSGVAAAESNSHTHPKAIGRRQRRSAETRLRLFRCALQLIAKRGLSNVTVEDITEAADVGKGTFFNYFETKDQVLGVMAEIQVAKIKEASSRAALGKQAIYAVLRQLAQRLAEEPGRSPGLARAFISSFLANDRVREIVKRNMQDGRKAIEELVTEGQKRGEIDSRLKSGKIALQFLQACIGSVLLWSLHEKPALGAWIEDSFQHFWRSIVISGKEQEP
ncbi:MAG TPA: TetR/AcrR family transcriptional regulator [Terracidiphilus sp.]|nr:TetR/AcrR family transcriptional regulator [Terracidiphilus sp.]